MTKIYQYIIMASLLALCSSLKGQQLTIFEHNIINPYSINPAKAGEKGNQIFLHHRNQWISMPGSVESTSLTAEWRLSESKSAIGFNLSNDIDNIIRNTSAYFTYAYHTKINDDHSISFGLSTGIRNNAINFEELFALDGDDPVIWGYNQSGTKFDGSLGLSYKYKFLDVQLSALQLLGTNAIYYNTNVEEKFSYNFITHYFGSVGYTFNQLKDFKISPMLQVRGAHGYNLRPDAIVKAEYQKKAWMALRYGHKRSVALLAGMAFNEIFTISYSAEFSTNKLVSYNGATHEILFGIKFGKAFDRTVTRQKIDAYNKQTNSYNERLEYLKRENDKLKKQMDEQRDFYEQIKEQSGNKEYDELKKEIDELKKNQKELKQQEPESETKEQQKVKEMMQSKAGNVQFEQGNAVIKESSFSALNEMVELLKSYADAQISIEGHTDNTGNENTNLKLSQSRANSVKQFLIEKGVSSNQITAIGKGSSEPKADNSTQSGRKANRRVEFEISF